MRPPRLKRNGAFPAAAAADFPTLCAAALLLLPPRARETPFSSSASLALSLVVRQPSSLSVSAIFESTRKSLCRAEMRSLCVAAQHLTAARRTRKSRRRPMVKWRSTGPSCYRRVCIHKNEREREREELPGEPRVDLRENEKGDGARERKERAGSRRTEECVSCRGVARREIYMRVCSRLDTLSPHSCLLYYTWVRMLQESVI